MLSELGRRPMLKNGDGSFGDDLEKDIGLLLREQRRQEADDYEKELNLYRSGSAPPTVEGSMNAVGDDGNGNGFASEEELRSDPAYLSYYYSNVNLNPRLPPPLLSKEDWRFAQRLKGGSSGLGGIGDRRKMNRNDSEWGGDGLIGLSGLGLGSKQKSLAEIFQDDLGRTTPVSGHPSRPASRNAFDENAEPLGSGSSTVQNIGAPTSYTYASVLGGSLSRSTTPDPQLIARAPSPCLTPIGGGRTAISEKRGINGSSSFNSVPPSMNESADLVAALSGMDLSTNGVIDEENHLPSQIEQDVENHQSYLFNLQGGQSNIKQHSYLKKSESGHLQIPSAPQSGKASYSDSVKSNGVAVCR
ncbi:unnamed protein product, partial [Vitis vinifera]